MTTPSVNVVVGSRFDLSRAESGVPSNLSVILALSLATDNPPLDTRHGNSGVGRQDVRPLISRRRRHLIFL